MEQYLYLLLLRDSMKTKEDCQQKRAPHSGLTNREFSAVPKKRERTDSFFAEAKPISDSAHFVEKSRDEELDNCAEYKIPDLVSPSISEATHLAFVESISSESSNRNKNYQKKRIARPSISDKSVDTKTYVIDTNVFLFDPHALYRFKENDIVIPDIVLDEIDNHKSEQNERGANAREFARQLLKIRNHAKPNEDLHSGVTIGEGMGKVRIGMPIVGHEEEKADKVILLATKAESSSQGRNAVLVTKDIMLRVRADAEGVEAEDYRFDRVLSPTDGPYLGRTSIWLPVQDLRKFMQEKEPIDISKTTLFESTGEPFQHPMFENEFCEMYPCEGTSKSAVLGRYTDGHIVPLHYSKICPSGIHPLNIGQQFALEALLMPPSEAPLVILKGPAGTAKTLLSLASAIEAYRDGGKLDYSYNRILVSRPAVVLDEPLGFLPGTEEEKMSPFIRGLKDNMLVIRSNNQPMSPHEYQQAREEVDEDFYDMIDVESLSFLRGRSLHNYFAFFDEMQNATTSLVKTIITRAGNGTKVVLAGDIEQIDMLYLNASYNGLTYASEKMKGSPLCWQVTMKDSESCRSPLAKETALRMKDSSSQPQKNRH